MVRESLIAACRCPAIIASPEGILDSNTGRGVRSRVRVLFDLGPAFDCGPGVLLFVRRVQQRLSRRSVLPVVRDELFRGLGGAMASEIVDGPDRVRDHGGSRKR